MPDLKYYDVTAPDGRRTLRMRLNAAGVKTYKELGHVVAPAAETATEPARKGGKAPANKQAAAPANKAAAPAAAQS